MEAAITDVTANLTGVATAALAAVTGLAVFGAGFRVIPRVIRILASKVAG